MSGCGNGCTSCAKCREAPYAQQPIVGARDAGDVARQAEGVFNGLWQAVAPIVPYGTQIDAGVQGIRRAAGLTQAAGLDVAMVREAQAVTRRVRKGDRAAKERYQAVKRAGGPRWRVYVAVARDDQRRIDAASRVS